MISCSDDDNVNVAGSGSFTAKVDGTTFESLAGTVGATVNGSVAGIQGSKADGEYIRINIVNYTGVGTYTTGDALTNTNMIIYGTISPNESWVSTFDVGSGTIEITSETSTTIEGTFSFTGENNNLNTTKVITEGQFSAPKQ